ncbi:hypothetical protein H113_08291, partial [Trichophyton rubrum MR1459]
LLITHPNALRPQDRCPDQDSARYPPVQQAGPRTRSRAPPTAQHQECSAARNNSSSSKSARLLPLLPTASRSL